MSGETLATLGALFVTVLLIGGNALYVFHEFAFVRLRAPEVRRIERSGARIDRLVAKMAHRLDHYIAVDQLGITVTSLAVGWIGQPAVTGLFEDLFRALGAPLGGNVVTTLSFIVAFALITATQVVLGELVPKTVALRSARRTAALVAVPVEISAWLFHPLVVVLNGAGNALARLLGVEPQTESHAEILPAEELESVIQLSARAGLVPVDPQVIRQALHFSDLKASDLIVPRQEMVVLDVSMSTDEVLAVAREHRLTRYPVIDGSLDRVVGILNVKEILEVREDGSTGVVADWQRLIQPALILPGEASIEAALQAMLRENQYLALLADDYGSIEGMFTISDVSRMITGASGDIVEIGDGVYSVTGETAINVVETVLDLSLGPGPGERDYDSVGGLVMARLGRIPKVGDELTVNGHRLRVDRMQGLRVAQVTLRTARPDARDGA